LPVKRRLPRHRRLIKRLREQKRDVYIDPFADQLAKRRNALGCARDFNHKIFAGDALPQAARLVERAVCVVREIRRNFEADVAVALFGVLVHGGEYVGRILNIADGEQFVAALGIEIGASGE